jgi:predicted dehydrogenase
MLAASRRAGAVLATGYQQRFRSNNVRAREMIRSGAVGRVLTIQVSMPLHRSGIQSGGFGGSWAWWDDPASVGHVFNSAPHAIDLIRWFTGAEVANVSAYCRTVCPGHLVEDTTMAIIEFSDGALCSLFSSNALPAAAFPGEDFRFRIMGTSGLMDLDPYGELRLADARGWRSVCRQPQVGHESADTAFGDTRMQAYCDQLRAFIDGIGGEPLRCGSGADGRAGVAACAAMLASSAERRCVALRG